MHYLSLPRQDEIDQNILQQQSEDHYQRIVIFLFLLHNL